MALDARHRIVALADLMDELIDTGESGDRDENLAPIMARWTANEERICGEAPASLADVAVKLRVLAVTGGGMDASVFDGYNASLAQVLAFLDDLLQRCALDGAGRHVALRTSELRELSRSTGDRAEATDREVDSLRSLLSWVESKVRRSKADWPRLRETLAARLCSEANGDAA
jgi:hypothetical protein